MRTLKLLYQIIEKPKSH